MLQHSCTDVHVRGEEAAVAVGCGRACKRLCVPTSEAPISAHAWRLELTLQKIRVGGLQAVAGLS